ncbi:TPA: zinc-ribbon domain-containing protein [Clostridioides difficile]|nr:hypothetical protein [Clostridioides difficile]
MVEDVKLKKGMCRDEVNRLLKENDVDLELVDEIYGGNGFNHKWKCECGNIIEKRTWQTIKGKGALKCNECKRRKIQERYKYEVEKDGEYEYIRCFLSGDILPNGEVVAYRQVRIEIKHKFCGRIYNVNANNFINQNQRCDKCCGSYENSFAYYIEKELCEPLEKYWDYKKNVDNPYHISKNRSSKNSKKEDLKIWIKCTEKDYHGSYCISCSNFVSGKRCPYCSSKKIHFKDSFANYHIDNTDKDFLIKYWDYRKNIVNPFSISKSTHKKVWIKCQIKEYHESYLISCSHFTNGKRCSFCSPSSGYKIHVYDSFGYSNFDLSQSWSLNNEISPFKVSKSSGKKYKFICPKCGKEFERIVADIKRRKNVLCNECSMSEGEKQIVEWISKNNIKYTYEKQFNNLTGLKGGNLSYDFYFPKYKLLIEYQGEFHDGTSNMPTEEQYKKQQEHDRRKKEYAKNNGYKLLEIWYWDFDNIEEILDKEIGSLL